MGYLIVAPVLRILATLLMVFSIYQLLKVRQDNHKLIWIAATVISPLVTRIVYEVYRRLISKKAIGASKGSTTLAVLSVIAVIVSAVLTAGSVLSMGVGLIKSEIDGESLATYYDVHGNEYVDPYEIPLHDKDGNVYTHEIAWFTEGTYIDQNGKSYDGDRCYLSEDGYFYYDESNKLKPYGSADYYTDGEKVYYDLFGPVYWSKDGTVYEKSGRLVLELFDFK